MNIRVALAAAVAVAAVAWAASSQLSYVGGSIARQVPTIASNADSGASAAELAANAELAPGSRVEFGDWEYAGPANIGANVASLVPAPGGVVYALSPEGTVFRSTDQAAHWQAVATLAPQDENATPMRQLAVLPANGDHADIYFTLAADSRAASLYRMVQGEAVQRSTMIGIRTVRVVGSTVYAGGVDGLWRSDDAGASWQKILAATEGDAGCTDIAAQGDRIYAVCDDTFYRSVNGGAFAGLWQSSFLYFSQLAVSRSNPDVIYIGRVSGGTGVWLHRSTDGGASWTQVVSSQTETNPMNRDLLGNLCRTQTANAPDEFAFAVDPLDPMVVWIGSTDLYRSDDGGENFGRASLAPAVRGQQGGLANGSRAIAFPLEYTPGSPMYVATSAGVYATLNPRAAVQTWPATSCGSPDWPYPAVEWAQHIEGFSAQRIMVADVLPDGDVLARIGPVHGGGLYYGTLSESVPWLRMSDQQPETIMIDPMVGMDRFYTSPCTFGPLCRWDANGSTWNQTPARSGFDNVTPQVQFLAYDRRVPGRLWSAGYYGALRSDNDAATWMSVDGQYKPGGLWAGAVSPADSNIVIFGGSNGALYRRSDALSANSSTVWPEIRLVDGAPEWFTRSIVFDEQQPQRVYATGSRTPSVFASADAGLTWRAADRPGRDDGLPDSDVQAFAVDPLERDVLYAGTRAGLYVTWNAGAIDAGEPVWFQVPTPFRDTPISKLVVRPAGDGTRWVYAFTAGRGIWRSKVSVARFNDVSRQAPTFDYISRVAAAGITSGCGTYPAIYCPDASVLREQMAVFLLRAAHGGAYVPPAATGTFSDVPLQSGYAPWIEQLARESITSGCGAGFYCPGEKVSRAQMAVFLLRAKHGAAYQPPAAIGQFADVAPDHAMAAWIEQLAREGVTSGCSASPARYCPDDAVTRAQMAVFLVKTFGL